MKQILLPLALLALTACTDSRQPLGDSVFIENEYQGGKYAGMTVHKTAQCAEIKSGVQPKKMTRFTGWYEITKATQGADQAKYLDDDLRYCPKCLNDAEIKQLDDAFHHPIEIVKK